MSSIEIFQEEYYSSIEPYWRSVILLGKNVASYRFALAKSLLEIAPTGKIVITLEGLAVLFSKNLCEHIVNALKQVTSKSSQFLDTCTRFNQRTVSYDELINTTVRK